MYYDFDFAILFNVHSKKNPSVVSEQRHIYCLMIVRKID